MEKNKTRTLDKEFSLYTHPNPSSFTWTTCFNPEDWRSLFLRSALSIYRIL